ncbi:MAG: hypothetical protein RL274_1779 [Pseudomonadota bacterium]|jgi:hypothetical protein
MSILFKAGVAFVFAAQLTGNFPPLSPHWRAVAADLHQAQPQAKVKATVFSLFHNKKG